MKWIPVTERLPECKLDCIVHQLIATLHTDDPIDGPEVGEVTFDCRSGEFCYPLSGIPYSTDGFWKVTAWMELPKPFKKGD